MEPENLLLELKSIRKEFILSQYTDPLLVLKKVSLKVFRGDSIAITGPSGSGKTTLLNILGTLDYADSGTYFFDNKPMGSTSDKVLSHFRNTHIGFIFQLHHLLPQCTVLENVLMPALPAKKKLPMDRAKDLLKKVGLENRISSFPAQLSGGEMQRVSLVRALINKPSLILADEPTGSLDMHNSENLISLLVDLNKKEKFTLITVTHSQELAKKMDRNFTLENGILSPAHL